MANVYINFSFTYSYVVQMLPEISHQCQNRNYIAVLASKYCGSN
jgi:hypothetical protein